MTSGTTRTCAFERQVGPEHYYFSCAGDSYHCKADHRARSNDKSAWKVSRPEECHTFCNSESDPESTDPASERWFISPIDEIGTNGEHLARFLPPDVSGATWHGFPVGGRRRRAKEAFPSEELATKWRVEERIDRAIESKIIRRTI
jgi:hypothetical protein